MLIEVDGAIHMKQDRRLYDAARQEDVEAQGYRVTRITTNGVEQDLSDVVGKIIDTIQPPPPSVHNAGESGLCQREQQRNVIFSVHARRNKD